jgi:hypothetical protein
VAIKRDYVPEGKPAPKKPKAVSNGWTHDGLILDLCARLEMADDYICNEVYAGSRFLERRPVPDVLRVRMSYTRPDFSVYEIKVSRADFLSDIRLDKWQTYLPYCGRFYFATPAEGVCTIDDIPFVAGWMVRGAEGWRTMKTPKVREFTPDYHYALALLISEQKNRWKEYRRAEAFKAIKHPDNVRWSKKMADRVTRYEGEVRDSDSIRRKLTSAKAALKEHFGIDLANRYAWDDSVAKKIAEMKSGLSERHVDNLRHHLKEITDVINAVAGPEKDGDDGKKQP